MNFWKILAILALASVLTTGCGNLSNMVKKHPTDAEYIQKPNPLEKHGDKMKVNVAGSYKPKYFNKKAGVIFQPELKYEGGSLPLHPIVLKGESVTNLDGTMINNANGGTFTYTEEIPYKPEYKDAELIVNPTAFLAKNAKDKAPANNEEALAVKKALPLGEKTLASGVNTTPDLADNQSAKPSFAKDNYRKPDNVFTKATLHFVVDMSNLNMNLAANKTDEAKKAFEDLKTALKDTQEIASVKIVAWASPEGELSRNNNLSKDRGKTGEKYLRDLYKKAIDELVKERNKNLKKGEKKVTAKQLTKELPLTTEAKGEDWDGFMKDLNASSIPDKSKIINVISSNTDHARREQEMRNMVVTYKEIEDQILPALRRSELVVEQVVPAKTNEQMAELSTSNPKELTVEELLFAATLANGDDAKLKVYTTATEVYPEDWRGFNDVAFYQIQNKNYDAADAALQKANALSANNDKVLNNMGVVALSKGDLENAKKYFNDAKAKGNAEANANLAPILISEGDYAGASSAVSGQQGDLNLALSQILSGDLPSAKQTLAAAKESPKAYYLKAIVAAREDNANDVYANLKNTSADYKKQAQTDVEFKKYAEQVEFTNALK